MGREGEQGRVPGVPSGAPEPVEESNVFVAHRGKIVVGLAMIVAALAYLGFVAFKGATVYYYTVGEIKRVDQTEESTLVRVSGTLVPASFSRPEGSTIAHFTLTDGSDTLDAFHNGVLPDLFFNEHSEIVLEGYYTESDVFESHNVIVKCPSKYEAADEGG